MNFVGAVIGETGDNQRRSMDSGNVNGAPPPSNNVPPPSNGVPPPTGGSTSQNGGVSDVNSHDSTQGIRSDISLNPSSPFFLHPSENPTLELDETCLGEFQTKWVGIAEYIEKTSSNIVEAALAIGRSKDYHLIIVGKGWLRPSTMVAELAGRHAEHAELGPIGDVLSSGQGVVSSVLVIQQHEHDLAHNEEETSASTLVHSQYHKLGNVGSSGAAGDISKVV